MPTFIHEQIRLFRHLFVAHHPLRKARMTNPGTAAKYITLHHPVRDSEIRAHLAGRLTLAAPLIGVDDTATAAALDVDSGGEAALWHLLVCAHARQLTAFAITSDGPTHSGGHVWLLFAHAAEASRFRQLANDLVLTAQRPAETYPTYKTIRLPLGVHRHTGARGRLLLPSGQVINLDGDLDAVAKGLNAIAALPRNSVEHLPALPPPPPRSPEERRVTIRADRDVILAFNQHTDVVALVEGYGGRIAQASHARVVMHCPCGRHAHGDRIASLEIRPARKARYGQHVAYGYAPGCAFYTERGMVMDAFAVYCQLEGLTPADAVRLLVARGVEVGQ